MARNDEPGMPRRNGNGGVSGKWTKYETKRAAEQACWSKIDTPTLFAALVAITNAGGALLLGKTRDGGSLCITICQGDERKKLYGSTREEIHEYLEYITDNA